MAVDTNNIANFRPMLAASLPCSKGEDVPTQEEVVADLQRLDWSAGFLASPKLDGIRATKHPQLGLVSRTLTQIPNRFMQEALASPLFDYFDGELIKSHMEDLVEFNDNQSAIMSRDGSPFFTYCVFDDIQHPNVQFGWRTNNAMERIATLLEFANFQDMFTVRWVPQKLCMSIEELMEFEEECVEFGYEGVIFRDPRAGYKNGRATFKQQGMTKLKRFQDAEAIIVGFEELKRNTNIQTRGLLGYAKRSSHKAGKVGADTLGKILVRGVNGTYKECDFAIGSGLDDSLRDRIWRARAAYMGTHVKYKYQPTGSKNAPRAPIFLGFRSEEDMG